MKIDQDDKMTIFNMCKLKFSLVSLAILVSMISFSQNKTWSLEACVNHAIENNITIQQGENALLTNEQNIIAAKGNFLPSVSGNAGHNIGIGTQRIDVGDRQVIVDRTSHSTSFGIGASQTVFNGFRLMNLYEQSKLNLETSKLELARIKDDVSLNVVNAYLNVLFNKENLETAKAQLEFSKKQLEQVKSLVDAGVQPRANIYDTEATLSSDEQNVTIAENNTTLALLTLSQLLQVPFEGFNVEVITIESPSEALLYDNVTPILNFALENRNEIKIAEKNIENAQLNTEISESGFLPSVSLGYGFNTNAFFSNLDKNEAAFLEQLNNQKGHSINLSVNVPIFSRFQNKTAVARSKIQEANSQLNLEQAKLNLESNIQRAFTDAKAAFKAFQAAKKSLAAQELSFSNSEERFKIGVMTSFDLDQARIRLVNSQASLINAKYDFVFKTKVLDFYMGKSLTN
ncbi:TolC family protein [Mariniflexile sp.]|uniref:TolC family protein n=1 Tax=Mariniflexile sp. TaxID=1979402 RepID=UPI003561E384